jgi:hypothetical protein
MNTVNDIINLIARRDNISVLEATNIVSECMDEMEEAVAQGYWQEAEDILMSYLGLEPDYLDILMTEMF